MNIKEQIGHRITIWRKAKKLTQAELAELAGGLRQSRVNNWEKGIRTPGLEEVKQLAAVLEVSPSYLMCLTDDQSDSDKDYTRVLIPLLNNEQAYNLEVFNSALKKDEIIENIPLIDPNLEVAGLLGENAFALKMNDESMEPEIKVNDILVIDTKRTPKPGNFVVAKHENNNEVIVRRFKLLSVFSSISKFELLALNTHWPNIQNSENIQCEILGTVISLNRKLL